MTPRTKLFRRDGFASPQERADFFISAGYSFHRVVALTGVKPDYVRQKKLMTKFDMSRANYRRNSA